MSEDRLTDLERINYNLLDIVEELKRIADVLEVWRGKENIKEESNDKPYTGALK